MNNIISSVNFKVMSAYINVFLNFKMDRHLFDIDIFSPSSLYVSHEYINRAKN